MGKWRAAGFAGATLAASTAAVFLRYRARRPRPGSPYFAGAPLLIAHRGGAGLAPENTLIAFRRAVEWWNADVLELDVQPTADGRAVVFHDETLDRTTDGSGPVSSFPLKQVQQFDAGYHFSQDGKTRPFRGSGVRVPTLLEVLQTFPTTRINIEIKDGRAQEDVVRSIRRAKAENRVLIAAGSRRNRRLFRDSGFPTSAGKEELQPFVIQLRLGMSAYTPAVDALQLPDRWDGRDVLSPQLVKLAHSQNLPVHVWSVNEMDDMQTYLDWGVDGVITDRPDRLAIVLNTFTGRPLPSGPDASATESPMEYLLPEQ